MVGPEGVEWQRPTIFDLLIMSSSERAEPSRIVTDKPWSYPVAHREVVPWGHSWANRHANKRVEQLQEATRVRERGMRKFKSVFQAQRFVTDHAAASNLFNLGRHLVRAEHYRNLRTSAFSEWSRAVA